MKKKTVFSDSLILFIARLKNNNEICILVPETLFESIVSQKKTNMKKFLITGLGNIGSDYKNTRHNIGFQILDEVAKNHKVSFETEKLGDIASCLLYTSPSPRD